jgi:hypothetical protein
VSHDILLSQGLVALVDDDDFERVSTYIWFADRNKGKMWYGKRNILNDIGRRSTQYMHRFILDAPKGVQVDHINGDGLDNRRDNLRLCNNAQNHANLQTPSWGVSGYRGVYPKGKKWEAKIEFNGKSINLGAFETIEEALMIRVSAAQDLFGEFSNEGVVVHDSYGPK